MPYPDGILIDNNGGTIIFNISSKRNAKIYPKRKKKRVYVEKRKDEIDKDNNINDDDDDISDLSFFQKVKYLGKMIMKTFKTAGVIIGGIL